ncbi:DUF3179 domain-containing protein [Nocardioides sp.]|uniref:DUF3179 domain-containing protein n=1 Tax=Nocardioides sp. TaxID=35761 RepID=UPI0035660E70
MEPSDPEETPSALDNMRNPAFPEPLIDVDQVLDGGPPPDGIPPIDEPRFDRAADVDWLADNEPVMSLTVGAETRAYPLQVMTWHEIVNDTVGGTPVAVTYCPLCNSGVAFEREVGGRVLTFGTSGRLYADNLVMYDRQTESLWPQLTGEASIGVLTGEKLAAIPMGVVSWQEFREAFGDSLVLNRRTGHDRPYGQNPYLGYDDLDSMVPFRLPEDPDDRLVVKERVIGLARGDDVIAVLRSSLVGAEPRMLELDGTDVVLWHRPGQSSALDTGTISKGADIGSVGVFETAIKGRELTFARQGNGFRDAETGTRWNVLGQATSGPLAGKRLTPVVHLDTFWFAWVTFHPETELIR